MSRLSEMVFIRNQQTQRWMDVTGEDVACWSDKRQYIENSSQCGFWATLGQLLLAGFCCLIMIGCGSAEVVSPEVAKRAEELSAPFAKQIEQQSQTLDATLFEVREVRDEVKQNTTALAAIKSQIETLEASVVSSKPNGKEVIQSSEPPATANDTPKSSQVATPAASFSRIASDGTRLRWNIEGNWNPTILETSAHLREHGINTDGMTHQQMADLHASIHEGKPVAMKSETVRYVSRGTSCPGGVCPTSSTRYVRRSRR
jgi:hypothetical protein